MSEVCNMYSIFLNSNFKGKIFLEMSGGLIFSLKIKILRHQKNKYKLIYLDTTIKRTIALVSVSEGLLES